MDRITATAYVAEGVCPLDDTRLLDCARGTRGLHGTCQTCGNCFLLRDGAFVLRVHGLPKVLAVDRAREVSRRIIERTAP